MPAENLTDLYSRMCASPRLAGVAQQWGALADTGQGSTQVVWVPTQDTLEPGEHEHVDVVRGGERLRLKQRWQVRAGCEIRIYAPGQPLAAAVMLEDLRNRIVLALEDQHDLQQGYELGPGRHMQREEVHDGATGYVLSIALAVPIYDQQPAAPVRSVTTTTR